MIFDFIREDFSQRRRGAKFLSDKFSLNQIYQLKINLESKTLIPQTTTLRLCASARNSWEKSLHSSAPSRLCEKFLGKISSLLCVLCASAPLREILGKIPPLRFLRAVSSAPFTPLRPPRLCVRPLDLFAKTSRKGAKAQSFRPTDFP
jgi:hypothetical protein